MNSASLRLCASALKTHAAVLAVALALPVAAMADLTLDEPVPAATAGGPPKSGSAATGGPGAVPAAAHGVSLRFYRNFFSGSLAELEDFARLDVCADISLTLPDFTLRDPWTLKRDKGITRCYGAILDAVVTVAEPGDYRFILPSGGGRSSLFVSKGGDPEGLARVELAPATIPGMPEYRLGRSSTPTAEKARASVRPMRLKADDRLYVRAVFVCGWEDRFFVGWSHAKIRDESGDGDDDSLELKDWAVEKPVFETPVFTAIPAAQLTPAPAAGATPRLTVGNPSLPIAVHPDDDEPDSLCWDRFADEPAFVAHFLDWAATNPPPQEALAAGGGAQTVGGDAPAPLPPEISPGVPGQSPRPFGQSPRPFVWIKTSEVALETNTGRWCNTNVVRGAGVVALKGPPSHDFWANCHFDVEVPVAGDYRLWCRHWRPKAASSGTFNLSVQPAPSANPAEDGIEAVLVKFQQTFARSNGHPGRPNDPTPQIMAAPYPPGGWMWECTHRTAHLEPGRYRFTFSSGAYPAQDGAVISDVVLTADPMLDPATVPPRETSGTGTFPPSEALCNPLFAIRPGADIDNAPPARLAWWRRWRDALFDKLCDAEYTDYVWGYLATLNTFDEDSNLIGRVREVRTQKSVDARPSGFIALTGDDFSRTNGWAESAHQTHSYGQAHNVSRDCGATNRATFAEIEIPHAGRYRLKVRYYGWNGACVAAVEAGGGTFCETVVGVKGGRDNWAVSAPAELPAGKARVTLTTCDNPKHGGQPAPKSYNVAVVTRVELVERPDAGVDGAEIHYPDGSTVGDGPLGFWCQDPFNAFTRFSPPAAFPTNLYGSYNMATDKWTPLPAEEIGKTDHDVEAVSGEVKSQLVLIRNNTDAPIVIAPKVVGELPASVRLVAYTVTSGGMWSPQILLRREEVACPPRQNTALWVSIDCRGAAEGDYPVTLRFADKAVTWHVAVRGTFDGVPEPYLYPYARPYSRKSCWELYRDYGLNTVSYVPIPRKAMEEYGVRLLIGIPREGKMTEESVRRVIARAAALGQRPGDYTWYLIDEPGPGAVTNWIAMARTIKAVDPDQYLWCNLGDGVVGPGLYDLYFPMMDYWDVSCPFLTQFRHDEKNRPYYEKLKKTGKVRLTYHTLDIGANEKRLQAPQDLLNLADFAIREGLDGYANFSLMNGTPYDDLYMDNQDLAVSIYPGSRGRTLATRNLEAFREGGQRWRRAKRAATGDE